MFFYFVLRKLTPVAESKLLFLNFAVIFDTRNVPLLQVFVMVLISCETSKYVFVSEVGGYVWTQHLVAICSC